MNIGFDLEKRQQIAQLTDGRNLTSKELSILEELGVRLVKRIHPNDSYMCHSYLFRELLKANWYGDHDKQLRRLIYERTSEFLATKGFVPTEYPTSNDIAVYSARSDLVVPPDSYNPPTPLNKNTALHFGLMDESGRILSKWGEGNIYNHQVASVIPHYGDTVVFYTTSSTPPLQRHSH